ncbi:MAG: class I SAM-dependent methyltransferase [Candidatus Melainabacteria bacterium]|jgi:2-polyprenyl-3-methyl-5-hydroxy-6-metoxy-1,4-benzoquinol methylase|nr:class I SAM-dependent methyltransferase [Candidatus Melainabacteria bacterium]
MESLAHKQKDAADRPPKHKIATVDSGCNLCGSYRRALVTTGKEHEYTNTTDDVFNVVRCTGCQLIYLDPRPDFRELGTIYPPNYYSYNQDILRRKANPKSILSTLRYKGFRQKIAKSLKLAGVDEKGKVKILDIGCGDGHLLNLYRDGHADKVETHGVDFNLEAVVLASAAGHRTYRGRFEDAQIAENEFDLVIASHVIEHVSDPVWFTQKVYSILKPGGIFWFETPNIGSVDAQWFKNAHWGGYHFPRHWFFFTPETVRMLAEKTGFAQESIDFVPNAIFWFWTFHSMIVAKDEKLRPMADLLFPPIDFQKDSIANFLRICLFSVVDVLIKRFTGQTSNMIVVFRRP